MPNAHRSQAGHSGGRDAAGSLLAAHVPSRRLARANRAQADFDDFRARFSLSLTAEAVALYLTSLAGGPDITGTALRHELSLLDLHARLRGNPSWSQHREIRTLLRGLHQTLPFERGGSRSTPLYAEHIRILVDTIMRPSDDQIRAVTTLLLMNETGLTARTIATLAWPDVRLTRDRVRITAPVRARRLQTATRTFTVPRRTGDTGCLVAALRRVRAIQPSCPLVVGRGYPVGDYERARAATATLFALRPRVAPPVTRRLIEGDALAKTMADLCPPTPAQLRDRALVLLGYGAALKSSEAVVLKQGHIRVRPEGLLIDVPGRPTATGVLRSPSRGLCPAAAWQEWISAADSQGMADPSLPAFLHIYRSAIVANRLNASGLVCITQQRCAEAHLEGDYGFGSLRIGMLRSAIRAKEHGHRIVAHAGMRHLSSLQRHEERENLLADNVAGMLGL